MPVRKEPLLVPEASIRLDSLDSYAKNRKIFHASFNMWLAYHLAFLRRSSSAIPATRRAMPTNTTDHTPAPVLARLFFGRTGFPGLPGLCGVGGVGGAGGTTGVWEFVTVNPEAASPVTSDV